MTDKENNLDWKILNTLNSNPSLTLIELSSNLHYSKKTIAYHIKRLKENGISPRVGTPKSGYWHINTK